MNPPCQQTLFSENGDIIGMEKASGLLVDLTALSIEEEIGIAFLEKINPHYLKIKL